MLDLKAGLERNCTAIFEVASDSATPVAMDTSPHPGQEWADCWSKLLEDSRRPLLGQYSRAHFEHCI